MLKLRSLVWCQCRCWCCELWLCCGGCCCIDGLGGWCIRDDGEWPCFTGPKESFVYVVIIGIVTRIVIWTSFGKCNSRMYDWPSGVFYWPLKFPERWPDGWSRVLITIGFSSTDYQMIVRSTTPLSVYLLFLVDLVPLVFLAEIFSVAMVASVVSVLLAVILWLPAHLVCLILGLVGSIKFSWVYELFPEWKIGWSLTST